MDLWACVGSPRVGSCKKCVLLHWERLSLSLFTILRYTHEDAHIGTYSSAKAPRRCGTKGCFLCMEDDIYIDQRASQDLKANWKNTGCQTIYDFEWLCL